MLAERFVVLAQQQAIGDLLARVTASVGRCRAFVESRLHSVELRGDVSLNLREII
jgi:hypothetical protein